MNRSGIEWCDHTMNFITGCHHGCPYCYARRMVQRFSGNVKENVLRTEQYRKTEDGLYILENEFRGEDGKQVHYPFGFEPTLHEYRFRNLKKLKEGCNIFVGAMSDVFGDWVPDDWIKQVFMATMGDPQHNYLFLTKNPGRYIELLKSRLLPDCGNYWYGTSVTCNGDMEKAGRLPADRDSHSYISFEPLREELAFPEWPWYKIDWFIIGAETGNQKGRVRPEKSWIDGIVRVADEHGIPVFMKDSLIPIVGESGMRRDFPAELKQRRRGKKTEEKLTAPCIRCRKVNDKRRMITLLARAGRGGMVKTLTCMCRACYRAWCRELCIDGYEKELFAHVEGGTESDGKETELQTYGG